MRDAETISLRSYLLSAPSGVQELVADVVIRLQQLLGGELLGAYIFGSIVVGGFSEAVSDVDLCVVVAHTPTPEQCALLEETHSQILLRWPWWQDRLEIVYVGAEDLRDFKASPPVIAVMRPGESFHLTPSHSGWLLNWYVIRSLGHSLWGPSAKEFIPEITADELVTTAAAQATEWRTWVHSASHQGFLAYAVLTACRALYTVTHREIVSKQVSAAWAIAQLPQWSSLIKDSLVLRELGGHAGTSDQAATVLFVNAAADRIQNVVR